jgi:hypothetical protein
VASAPSKTLVNQREVIMRSALLLAMLAMPVAVQAAPVTGSISFDGSNSYDTTSVTFIGAQNAQSDSGALGLFGACTGCIAFKNLVFSPFSPVTNEISGTNNGLTLGLDLTALTTVSETSTFLDIAGNAVLHLTGFAATPGAFFFSTQGPQGPEVSFSADVLPVAEPASLALLSVGVLGIGFVSRRRSL